jgi:hypothetical protein
MNRPAPIPIPVKLIPPADAGTDNSQTNQRTRKMEISQRKGLSRLPTVIFQIIQKLSRQRDYRRLMNADSGTFSLIKSETISYWLKVSKGLDDMKRAHKRKLSIA